MLESCLYVTWKERGDDKDHREQHQANGDVPHESGRRPKLDQVMRAILRVAPNDQRKSRYRNNRKQAAVHGHPYPLDNAGARLAKRDEHMRREENRQTENENA